MDGENKNVHANLRHMWSEKGVPPRFIRHLIKFLIEYGVYQPWMELLCTSESDYSSWADPVLLARDEKYRIKAMINAPISHLEESHAYEDNLICKKFIATTSLRILIDHWRVFSTHFDPKGKKK